MCLVNSVKNFEIVYVYQNYFFFIGSMYLGLIQIIEVAIDPYFSMGFPLTSHGWLRTSDERLPLTISDSISNDRLKLL